MFVSFASFSFAQEGGPFTNCSATCMKKCDGSNGISDQCWRSCMDPCIQDNMSRIPTANIEKIVCIRSTGKDHEVIRLQFAEVDTIWNYNRYELYYTVTEGLRGDLTYFNYTEVGNSYDKECWDSYDFPGEQECRYFPSSLTNELIGANFLCDFSRVNENQVSCHDIRANINPSIFIWSETDNHFSFKMFGSYMKTPHHSQFNEKDGGCHVYYR